MSFELAQLATFDIALIYVKLDQPILIMTTYFTGF